VPVHHEILFAVFLVHGRSSFPSPLPISWVKTFYSSFPPLNVGITPSLALINTTFLVKIQTAAIKFLRREDSSAE
jgi:hypothetical protein